MGHGKVNRKKNNKWSYNFILLRSVFINLLIDKQRNKKTQERKLVYKLFNCFAFVLACLYYLVLYQLITNWSDTFKRTWSWKAFRIFLVFLFMYSLHTISSGDFVFSHVFFYLFTKVETIFVRLESTEGPLRRPLQLCEALKGTAMEDRQRETQRRRKRNGGVKKEKVKQSCI